MYVLAKASFALQATSELKRLANRTVSLAGAASQASVNRHAMVNLLQFATGRALSRLHAQSALVWAVVCCC